MAAPRVARVVGVKLELSVPSSYGFSLLRYVVDIRPSNELPVALVEGELVVPILLRGGIVGERRRFIGDVFAGGPPDFDTLELVGDLLVVVEAED